MCLNSQDIPSHPPSESILDTGIYKCVNIPCSCLRQAIQTTTKLPILQNIWLNDDPWPTLYFSQVSAGCVWNYPIPIISQFSRQPSSHKQKNVVFFCPPRSFAGVISENMNMLVGYGWVYYSMISQCMPGKTYIIKWVVCILPANLTVGWTSMVIKCKNTSLEWPPTNWPVFCHIQKFIHI